MEMKCCICGKETYGYGNSALPIKNGICCNDCNNKFVIPARLRLSKLNNDKHINFEIIRDMSEFIPLERKLIEHDFTKGEILMKEQLMIYENPETEEQVFIYFAL